MHGGVLCRGFDGRIMRGYVCSGHICNRRTDHFSTDIRQVGRHSTFCCLVQGLFSVFECGAVSRLVTADLIDQASSQGLLANEYTTCAELLLRHSIGQAPLGGNVAEEYRVHLLGLLLHLSPGRLAQGLELVGKGFLGHRTDDRRLDALVLHLAGVIHVDLHHANRADHRGLVRHQLATASTQPQGRRCHRAACVSHNRFDLVDAGNQLGQLMHASNLPAT